MENFKTCVCTVSKPGANKNICSKCNGYIWKSINEPDSSAVPEENTFKWFEDKTDPITSVPFANNDIRMVTLPVRVKMRWSTKIVDQVDDDGKPLTYKSGWLMDILPDTVVYNNEAAIYLASAFEDQEDQLEESSELSNLKDVNYNLREQLHQGREYLMTVSSKDLDVSDVLEAFGFGRNGLKHF